VIDPISIGLAVILFAAGWITGRAARLRSTRNPPSVRPICECCHHYGTHTDEGCNAAVIQRVWDRNAGYINKHVSCACLRYVGPVPLDQFWTPPIPDSE
jgi:hypothetical protein